jgi:hypothetical protein
MLLCSSKQDVVAIQYFLWDFIVALYLTVLFFMVVKYLLLDWVILIMLTVSKADNLWQLAILS